MFDGLEERCADPTGVFHLSALMVPEHRTAVIREVRDRLSSGGACHLVSTQLIEAGVDVDFPVVFREMTGVDSLLQAGGRCNREGKLPAPGRVVVFDCLEFSLAHPSKQNWLSRMWHLGTSSLGANELDAGTIGCDAVERFFEKRYRTGSLDGVDGQGVYALITDPERRSQYLRGFFPYETIAGKYQFISDDSISVFVPWGAEGDELLRLIEDGGFPPGLYPLLQRYTVAIPRYLFKAYDDGGCVRKIGGFPVPTLETRAGSRRIYDEKRGLISSDEGMLDSLIVV